MPPAPHAGDVRARARASPGPGDADRAAIELADPHVITRELAAMRAEADVPLRVRKVETLECVALVREGRHAAAFELANRLVEQGARSPDLVAVRFEAACHLHMPCDLGPLPRALANLRRTGYGAWVDRLETLMR